MNSKQKIRKTIRLKRQNLSEYDQQSAGLAVLEQLKTTHYYLAAKKIAVYLENDGELPLNAVVKDLWQRKKDCFLPVIFNYQRRTMYFATYQAKTDFSDNRYGIPEPIFPIKKMLNPMHLDLVLLPLVAFDNAGNRIGMGGGFYDRTFAFLKRRQHWKKPRLIGVAHDFQEVETLQKDKWDISLDGIVTPSRYIKFK